MRTAWTVSIGLTATMVAVAVIAVLPAQPDPSPVSFPTPRVSEPVSLAHHAKARDLRARALSEAEVWTPSAVTRTDLGANPDGTDALSQDIVRCRFQPSRVDGTTPKFRCVLDNGEIVRVKYGVNAEIPAEAAATRLLTALGFGADEVHLVPRVRCYGCPRWTFRSMWIADRIGARTLLTSLLPDDRYTDFAWVAVERRLPGAELVTGEDEGWAWFELTDEGIGPAQRASRDALRLLARFLAHWDNKAENQRLVCRTSTEQVTCGEPRAYLQDLGATFGPRKMDLVGWEHTAIWADRERCRITMRDLPHGGGTFPDVTIREPGRQLLVRQLTALSNEQVTALFQGARVREFFGHGRSADPAAWANVFSAKVRELASGPACPS